MVVVVVVAGDRFARVVVLMFARVPIGPVMMLMLGCVSIVAVMVFVLRRMFVGAMMMLVFGGMLVCPVVMRVFRRVGRAARAGAEQQASCRQERREAESGEGSVHLSTPSVGQREQHSARSGACCCGSGTLQRTPQKRD